MLIEFVRRAVLILQRCVFESLKFHSRLTAPSKRAFWAFLSGTWPESETNSQLGGAPLSLPESVQRFTNPCEVFTIPWISRQPMTALECYRQHPTGCASEILIGCFEWWLDFKMTWGPNIVWHLQHPQATGRDINLFLRAHQFHLRFDRSTMISGFLVKPCRPRQMIWPLPRRPLKKMYINVCF